MYLRDLRPGDLDGMYALDVVCFPPEFRFTRAAMTRFAKAPHALVRIAANSEPAADGGARERLLAFGIVHLQPSPEGLTGYIVTLDVDPAFRGQGLASQLMGALELAAGEVGASTMSLHVFAENAPAIQLYERLGYRRQSHMPDWYGTGLDALCYRKSLNGNLTPEPA